MRRLLLILLERLCNRLRSQPKATTINHITIISVHDVGSSAVVVQPEKVITPEQSEADNKTI